MPGGTVLNKEGPLESAELFPDVASWKFAVRNGRYSGGHRAAAGLFRHPLPARNPTNSRTTKGTMSKIWIDLDNSPHVPLFRPIIRELEERGQPCLLTARDCFQVRPLLDLFNLKAKIVGRHYGKNKVMKVIGVAVRAMQLLPIALQEKPAIALSHGSRAQLVAARLLAVPTVLMADYEHVSWLPGFSPDWFLIPDVIPIVGKGPCTKGVLKYRGIKEDAYVPDFTPDCSIFSHLGINNESILVTIRPPATEAHYHNPESEGLLDEVIGHLGKHAAVQMVVLPRNEKQAQIIARAWPELQASGRLLFPKQAVDGLNLVWFSDLVVSGGGTMNREAAALGVPVYSIFCGKLGAVDQYLCEKGRLQFLKTPSDILTLAPKKRKRAKAPCEKARPALSDIILSLHRVLGQTPLPEKLPAAVPRVY
jgi:uncharacterized protein